MNEKQNNYKPKTNSIVCRNKDKVNEMNKDEVEIMRR